MARTRIEGWDGMDILKQDLRYAVRSLRRSPGVAALAVGCIGLGIGANAATFSIVYGVLLRPLPFAAADRVVSVRATNEARGVTEGGLAYADLEDYRSSGVFEALAGLSGRSFTLTGGDRPERVQGSSVTSNLFPLLGVAPRLGRGFREDDAAPLGFERVVLLSDDLWRRSFGADPSIVGRQVEINGRALIVVGVMPPRFRFPEVDELWVPLGSVDAQDRGARWIWGIGRLAQDVSLAGARSRLRAATRPRISAGTTRTTRWRQPARCSKPDQPART